MLTPKQGLCPACGYPVEANASDCDLCGADIAAAAEQRRAAASFLRLFAVSLMGAVAISMGVLIPAGLLAMFPRLVAPLWIAAAALGLALWLIADGLRASPEER